MGLSIFFSPFLPSQKTMILITVQLKFTRKHLYLKLLFHYYAEFLLALIFPNSERITSFS